MENVVIGDVIIAVIGILSSVALPIGFGMVLGLNAIKFEHKEKMGLIQQGIIPPAKTKGNNPKTGLAGPAPIYSTLAISMAGIVAARKKND